VRRSSASLITRDANGVITQINDVLLNVNEQITKGVDFELAYRQPMGRFGNTNFRLLGTYVSNLITVDSAGPGRQGRADGVARRGPSRASRATPSTPS